MLERYTRQVFQEDKQRGESRRWKATRVVERAMPQLTFTNVQKLNQQSAHGLIGALSFFRSF
jgi:hypothetical protein